MKKILMIATGGTIASSETENGLTPGLTGEQLVNTISKLKDICEIDCVSPISMDSTNIRPAHWLKIAEEIKIAYEKYDGFVVTHGTDTMAYSAAAISYIIQDSVKPIVFTGAQIPLSERNSDAERNLIDAFTYACDNQSHDVSIVFSGNVICGTRARKNYTKQFNAFGSINFPEIARIQGDRILRFVEDKYERKTKFFDYINPNVGLIKFVPGLKKDIMQITFDSYDAIVIESFGVGGIPEYSDYYGEIKKAIDKGKIIVLTTQVQNEGSDISVYKVGNVIKKTLDVLEAYDMTTEAVLTKLMWILGITNNFEEVKELFYKPIHHDILTTK